MGKIAKIVILLIRGGFLVDFNPDRELAKADYIVTRNELDSKCVHTKVLTPSKFCRLVGKIGV